MQRDKTRQKEIELELQKIKIAHREKEMEFKLEMKKMKDRSTKEYFEKLADNAKIKAKTILELQEKKNNKLKVKLEKKETKSKEYLKTMSDNAKFKAEQRENELKIKLELQEKKEKEIKFKAEQRDKELKFKAEQKENEIKFKTEQKLLVANKYIEAQENNINKKKESALEVINAKAEKEIMKNEHKDIDKHNIKLCRDFIANNYLHNIKIGDAQIHDNALELYRYNCEHIDRKIVCENIVNIYNKKSSLIKYILETSYKNPEHPDQHCIFYVEKFKHWFVCYLSESLKYKIIRIDFDAGLLPKFKEIINLYFTQISKIIPHCKKALGLQIDDPNTDYTEYYYFKLFFNKFLNTKNDDNDKEIKFEAGKVFKIDYK